MRSVHLPPCISDPFALQAATQWPPVCFTLHVRQLYSRVYMTASWKESNVGVGVGASSLCLMPRLQYLRVRAAGPVYQLKWCL